MTALVTGRTNFRNRYLVQVELRSFGGRARILHRGQPGADRLAARLARSWRLEAEQLEERDVVKILEQHRPNYLLVFGTWPGCQHALRAASQLGVEVRLIKG